MTLPLQWESDFKYSFSENYKDFFSISQIDHKPVTCVAEENNQ